MLNKLNTTEHLAQKHISTIQRCFLCLECTYSCTHVFHSCDFSFQVLMLCASNLNIVLNNSENTWSKRRECCDPLSPEGLLVLAFAWTIWVERNSRCFNSKSSNFLWLANKIMYLYSSWTRTHAGSLQFFLSGRPESELAGSNNGQGRWFLMQASGLRQLMLSVFYLITIYVYYTFPMVRMTIWMCTSFWVISSCITMKLLATIRPLSRVFLF